MCVSLVWAGVPCWSSDGCLDGQVFYLLAWLHIFLTTKIKINASPLECVCVCNFQIIFMLLLLLMMMLNLMLASTAAVLYEGDIQGRQLG